MQDEKIEVVMRKVMTSVRRALQDAPKTGLGGKGKWVVGIWCTDEFLKWAFGQDYGSKAVGVALQEAIDLHHLPGTMVPRDVLMWLKRKWVEDEDIIKTISP